MPNKSSLVAFLLSFLPGAGHLYMNRLFRGFLYGGGFFGSLFLIHLRGIRSLHAPDEFLILLALLAALTWVVNMLDMIIFLLRSQPYRLPGSYGSEQQGSMSSLPGTPILIPLELLVNKKKRKLCCSPSSLDSDIISLG